jgi:hypothetical protein
LIRYTAAPNALPLSAQHAWPVTITAVGSDISSKVFVYRASAAGDPFGGDAFSCVASVNQMFELPEDHAYVGAETQIPFYRTNKLELFCRSQAEADYIWRVVNEDIQALLNNFNLSFALQGTVSTEISGDTVTNVTPIMALPPTRIQLDYRPAGTATFTDPVQGISSADTTVPGWAPVSAAPPSWEIPPGAVFYYNIDRDAVLQKFWPLNSPLSANALYRNGILLPYGVTHVYTKDTIWWLAFDPSVLAGYVRIGTVQDANAPWPADYVDRSNPGETPTTLILMANGTQDSSIPFIPAPNNL